MTKPLPWPQKNNQEYVSLLEHFEPIIGSSKANRMYYSYLLKNGFTLRCWEPLCKLIFSSDKPFTQLITSITLQEPDTLTIGFLAELLAVNFQDEFCAYIYKQVKLNAAMDFHSLAKVLFYLGIGDGIRLNHIEKWSYPQSLNLIKNTMDRYWEEDDNCFKVKTYQGPIITIKYKNLQINIVKSSINQNGQLILRDYNRLKELIHNIYNSEQTVAEIKQAYMAIDPMFDKLFELFSSDKVLREFEEQLEMLILQNIPIVSISQAYYSVFGYDPLTARKNNSRKYINNSNLLEKYESLLKKKCEEQKIRRFTSNLNILRQRKSSFSLIFLMQNKIHEVSYEIKFNTMPIFSEWAEYILSLGDRLRNHSAQSTSAILNFVSVQHSKTAKLSARDITQEDLIDFLNKIEMKQYGASRAKTFFANMIDFLMAKNFDGKLPLLEPLSIPPSVNICKEITVKRPDQTANHIPMPESVFDEIMLHVDELEPTHKNAFELIAAGGLRPCELEGITPESLIAKKSKVVLCVWEHKKEKTKALKGKKPIREIPLNYTGTIQSFREQVRASEYARNISGHNSIFIRKDDSRSVYGVLTADQLKKAINKLIKRHNILNPKTGELWHYTPYQLRVSLVVEMIESGASDTQLKAFFGWNSERTMQSAYYMVRKRKLMEMNTEFFKREFAVNLSQVALDRYNEEELNEIVEMFYTTSREMAYGRCIRHPSQGICGKLHEASACAPCEHIKVSPHYRKKWEELYESQYRELMRLRLFYEQRGHISELYEKYEFYVVQSGILDSYANVLMNIDNPIIKKVVTWNK